MERKFNEWRFVVIMGDAVRPGLDVPWAGLTVTGQADR